jgi:acetyl esterase/lipase
VVAGRVRDRRGHRTEAPATSASPILLGPVPPSGCDHRGVSTTEPADAVEIIRLWPDGPPAVIEGVPDEVAYPAPGGVAAGTTFLRNVSDPTLTIFTPRDGTGNGVGVIVAPGGGWTLLAWVHEGLDVARWLAAHGYTAFLLKYRVQASDPDQAAYDARMAAIDSLHATPAPTADRPTAISDLVSTERYLAARGAAADDGRRAIELVRELAPTYGLRPAALGLIGFSAGAFLAVDVALDPRGEPLAFIAPIYGGETCGDPVPDDAPPLFTAVAHDDILRRIVEGLHLDWSAADRPSELHVFARGAHGFGMVEQGMPSDRWSDLFLAWLDDLGIAGP